MFEEKALWGIRIARALSATIEVTAVLLLLRMQDVKEMIRLNSVLGLVGPVIFIVVSALGLATMAGKIAPGKLLLVLAGVVLVLLGTRS